MKKYIILLLLLFNQIVMAIEIQLPTSGSNQGFFKDFTDMMQNVMNWMAGPWVLFIAIIVFISFAVGYFLDPRSAFLQSLLKAGFVIMGIFSSFSAILFIYNQF